MPASERVQSLIEQIFSYAEAGVFAIIDGASAPGLLQSIYQFEPQYCCLYRGALEPDLAEVAPYLVHLEPDSPFTQGLLEQGWGKHWGIFVLAEVDLRVLRQHFRKFLMVHDESGKPLYFRYYDPRVLRAYLPTCNETELRLVFGPVSRYYLEAEDPALLIEFCQQQGKLSQTVVELAKSKP